MIWRQTPKVDGRGHYGHRIAFGPDGFLYISSGERQKFTPAQDMQQNLGKIVRLNDDGSVPADNPFADRGGVTAQIWSLGHRNPLGLAFDAQGQLWNVEMGPQGRRRAESRAARRELRLSARQQRQSLRRRRHSGPRHAARPRGAGRVLEPRDLAVEPAVLQRQRVSGLAGRRVHRRACRRRRSCASSSAPAARRAKRLATACRQRIRAVEQGPDGAIWVLEDGRGGRLLKLTAARRAANALVRSPV